MEKNTKKEEKARNKILPTKFMLTVRVLVGAYLTYTAYSLIDGVMHGEGRDKYFLGIFMVAFAIIGILLMFFEGRDLLRGKYIGGELDFGEADADDGNDENASESVSEDEI